MKKERKAITRKVARVPADRLELEQFLVQIRQAEQMINKINTKATEKIVELNAQIDKLKKEAQTVAKPFEEEVNILADGVFIFAGGHRAELTDEEKRKTVEFTSRDKIRWYFPSPSVVVEDEEAAIAELKRRGLKEYIRTREEIDKERILRERERFKRLKELQHLFIDQTEIFAIVPAEMGFERQKGKRKFKRVTL